MTTENQPPGSGSGRLIRRLQRTQTPPTSTPPPQRLPTPPQQPYTPPPAPPPLPVDGDDDDNKGGSRFSLAFVVFIGTFLGSLLGFAADFNEALGTLELFQGFFKPELCIVGSNTVLGEGIGMAEEWAAAFEDMYDVNVTITGTGSVRGVGLAADGGCAHVLAMSEPMTEEQQQQLTDAGVTISCAAEIGYDVIAFVADANNEIGSLRTGQIISILRGNLDNWSGVGGNVEPIYILARPGSGTTEYVLRNLAYYTPTAEAEFPPDANYYECESNSSCLDAALGTRGSLYWVSTAWMRTQPTEYLRVLPILRGDEAPVNPLHDDVDLDEYHPGLVRPLFMYVLSGPNTDPAIQEMASNFLRYVRSVDGQQILESYHFYNHFDQPAAIGVDLPAGFSLRSDGPRQVCIVDVAE